MANDTERPRAGDPPNLSQPLEVLTELLDIERARLAVAVKIEQKRDIVFPETSMIVRDIMRIMEAIEGKTVKGVSVTSETDLDALLSDISKGF